MIRILAAAVLLLVGMTLGVVATGQSNDNAGGFVELHRSALANSSGLEAVMGLVERSGESASPKHYHPRGEFAFVIEGAVTVVTENAPPVVVAAGQSFYQPAGEWHIVSTPTDGARSVVFRVVENGEPMVIVVD